MFEFLSELKNKIFYEYAIDCEKSVFLHNNANSLVSFFEISFKIIHKEESKDFGKSIDYRNLHSLLGDNSFVSLLVNTYGLDEKDIRDIEDLKGINNELKHSSSKGFSLSADELYDYFQCAFRFASALYAKKTGNKGPVWSDAAYELMLETALSEEKQAKIVAEQEKKIAGLYAQIEKTNQQNVEAEKKADFLEKKLTEELFAKTENQMEIKNLLGKIKTLETTIQSSDSHMTVLQNKLEKNEQERREILSHIEEIKKKNSDSEALKDKNYAQEIGCLTNRLKQIQEEQASVSTENEILKREIKSKEEELSGLRKDLQKFARETERSRQLEKELKEAKTIIAKLHAETESLLRQVKEGREKLNVVSACYQGEETFQNWAINSAKRYYTYQDEKNEGEQITTVKAIRRCAIPNNAQAIYDLALSDTRFTLDYTDSLIYRIKGIDYTNDKVHALRFDRKNRVLRIMVPDNLINIMQSCRPEDIYVVSDLKFLIKRVEEWYKNYGQHVRIPTAVPQVGYGDYTNLNGKPSADQETAIKGILSTPFSYVWGAPGTGKTQFVLARAIMAYAQQGKKVLITAPTNQAVEQTLTGLIQIFNDAGMDYNELIIRYGTATPEFAQKYPEVCEDTGLNKALEEISNNIADLENKKKICKEWLEAYPEYRKYADNQKTIAYLESELPKFREDFSVCIAKITELKATIGEQQKKEATLNTVIGKKQSDIKTLDKKILKIRTAINQGSLLKTLKLTTNEKLTKELSETVVEKIGKENELSQAEEELAKIEKTLGNSKKTLSDWKEMFETEKAELSSHIVIWSALRDRLLRMSPATVKDCLRELEEKIQTPITTNDKKKTIFKEIGDRTENEIKDKIRFYDEEYKVQIELRESLRNNSGRKDPDKALVVAATIDKSITQFSPLYHEFSHVFLDEAGYCSAIKGLTLTAYGCPVTLLGDHMQLPPVCTLNSKDFDKKENQSVVLWAQSVLHGESALTDDPYAFFCKYKNTSEPIFDKLVKYPLVQSHRFGTKLAKVLSEEVYGTSFCGNDNTDTHIYYIDAKRPASKERYNPKEIEAVGKFLEKYPNITDVGIITPYKKDPHFRDMKKETQKHGRYDVINIHKAQGREWDTVLFSVTDTDNMYYTDSRKRDTRSLELINTAVSRAKKNLIIVCDYSFWSKKPDQLIGRLLSVAQKLDV